MNGRSICIQAQRSFRTLMQYRGVDKLAMQSSATFTVRRFGMEREIHRSIFTPRFRPVQRFRLPNRFGLMEIASMSPVLETLPGSLKLCYGHAKR
jgi:hypothetical protein